MLMQISRKKRILSSGVVFINLGMLGNHAREIESAPHWLVMLGALTALSPHTHECTCSGLHCALGQSQRLVSANGHVRPRCPDFQVPFTVSLPWRRSRIHVLLTFSGSALSRTRQSAHPFTHSLTHIHARERTHRYLEWMSTTPIMLFIIVSVTANGQGRHQKHGLVHNWRDTLAIVAWDEAMMIFGLLHATLMDRAYAWVLEWAACACLAMVFKGIWRAVRGGIQAAATTYEIHSMRVIEWLTYVLWTLMAVPHMLYSRDMISWQQFEVSSTVLDVVTKCVYSTTLLASNVCLLDVLETVRVDHLMADNSAKNSAVLRADMINQALHTSALEAEAEARLARRFLANVSHELRTPLNSIIAYTTLVVEDEPCEVDTHAEYCAASLTAAESLLGIINQVLEYAQIENELQLSSRLSLAQEPYSLLELFDQLPDIVGARVVERKIDLAIDLDEALLDGRGRQEGSVESARQVLIGDGFRVRQCLVNLVDNALKFAPAVGGEVLISVRLRDFRRSLEIGAGVASASCVMDEDPKKHFNVEYQPRVPHRDEDDAITNDGRLASQRAAQEAGVSGNGVRWATLSVQVMDNGIGIHPDKMFLLFKPFSQVHSEMTRKALGGTGLGLAITKSIVESMDGQVGCASAGLGAGSTFSLDIPVQLAPDVVLQSFPTLAPLPQTQDTHVRLAIFRGASERVLRQTLQHWGVLPDLITDLSLAAVTPSAAELALISERMMEDSRADAAHKVVYLCDLSVLQGLLESWGEVNREAGMDMLASLSGMVFLHPGEQRQLQQVLACDDGHLPSGWQSLLRPWKHLVFNSKLAACLEHLTQQASNRPGARSRRQTTAHASASQTSKPEPGSPKQRMPPRSECEPPRSLRALAADGQERVVADMLAGRDETGERVCADRRRILLVDDHAPNQKIAMRMIEKVLGADAVDFDLASDGLEAFRMVSTLAPDKGCYDIVFMDVQVPLSRALSLLSFSLPLPLPCPLPSLSFFLVCLSVCVLYVCARTCLERVHPAKWLALNLD